jgi:hypothetical protein
MVLACGGCAPEVVIGYAPTPQSLDAGEDSATPPSEEAGVPEGGMDAGSDGGPPDAGDAGDAGDPPDVIDAGDDDAEVPLPEITWPTGSHPGNDLAQYLEFGEWRDRPLAFAHVFPDRATWQGLINPAWPFDMFTPFQGRMMMSVPPYPIGMDLNNQDCAAGMYDDEWAQLGTFLTARGRGDTIIRLGWGPNDNDHEWAVAAGATPDTIDEADRDDWVQCFRNVVDAVRGNAPDVEIDWTINPFGPPMIAAYDPFLTYPGDDYVDYVGMELFDMHPPVHNQADWDTACNGPTGLCTLATFARARGKRIGIAEWGVVGCAGDGQPDTTGVTGGDNPFFIRKAVETFAANADIMGYDAYFEDGNVDLCSNLFEGGMNPESAAMYLELFRPR